MHITSKLHSILLGTLLFATPLAFTSVTAEYFATTKMYLLFAITCVSLFAFSMHVLISKHLRFSTMPFVGVLSLLVLSRIISLIFGGQNWIQALFTSPAGLFTSVSFLIVFSTHLYFSLDEKHENHHHNTALSATLSPLSLLSLGITLASVVYIFFYFKPFAQSQLPQHLLYLKNHISPLGSALDMFVLGGCAVLYFILNVYDSVIKKNYRDATKHLLGLTTVGIASVLLATFMSTSKQAVIQLPPMNMSWYTVVETLKNPQTALIGLGSDSFESLFTRIKPLSYNQSDTWNINFLVSRSALLQWWVETGLLGMTAVILLIAHVVKYVRPLSRPRYIFYTLLGTYILGTWILLPWSYMLLFLTWAYLLDLALHVALTQPASQSNIVSLRNHTLLLGSTVIGVVTLGGVLGYFSYRTYRAEVLFKESIDALQINDGKNAYDSLREAIILYPQNEKFRNQFAQLNLLLANNIALRAKEASSTKDAQSDKPVTKELTSEERQAATQFIQQSISEAKALVALNPTKASHWNTLATIYRSIIPIAQGSEAWAVASYQEALRRDPLNPQLSLNLGGVYYGAQDYASAVSTFRQSVIARPNWANAHYNLAWALFQAGEFEAAVASLKNATQLLDPASSDLTLAKENLKLFEEKLSETKATKQSNEGNDTTNKDDTIKNAVEAQAGTDTSPLELPATPAAQVSPGIKLQE